jgi:putative restriction endonuclease
MLNNIALDFTETASDFYQYLINHGSINAHTRTNYMSWLSYLAKDYQIDDVLNEGVIVKIIEQEKEKRKYRMIYKNEKDISNFRSALRKYLAFINFDFEKESEGIVNLEISKIETNVSLTITEKNSLILSRVGQGKFRKQLIGYWKGCSVSTYHRLDVLVASHIKPWKDADNFERIDVYNGLLLLPNYDKLFDRGYISFDKNGKILVSKIVSDYELNLIGINKNEKLIKIEDAHRKYLEYHRDDYFIH